MMAAVGGTVSAKLDLVCLEGPLQGERIELAQSGRVLFGRSKRGIHLADPQVSLEHCEVAFSGGQYRVVDLGSVSGTFVDDQRVGRDAIAVRPGQVVKIGESLFRLEEREEGRLWLIPVVSVLVLFGGVGAYMAWQLATPIVYAPALQWGEAIHQGAGGDSNVVAMPLSFVRAEGLDQTGLRIKKVTDYDADGVDEVWLTSVNADYVVTFGDNDWTVLGRLPTGCSAMPGGVFPDLRCGSDIWAYRDGKYGVASAQGTTVWIDWTPTRAGPDGLPPPKPAGPTPFRVGVIDPESLNGFLSVRGIEEPVQYIICEEAIPGIAAQVLTASGRIRPLGYGCIRELRIQGDGDLAGEIPLAVAFTASARVALLDDLREFVSGAPDSLFLDARSSAEIAVMATEPTQRVTMRLGFLGASIPGNNISAEQPIQGRRQLLAGSTGHTAPHAEVVTITDPVTRIDPPGCSELEVTVKEWYCVMTKLCLPNQAALTVEAVGCGGPTTLVSAPYTGGIFVGGDPNVEVRVEVDAHGGSGRVDVLRARVGWREVTQDP